jgi:hypothetical protein
VTRVFPFEVRLQMWAIALFCALTAPFYAGQWHEAREWWKLSNRKHEGRMKWTVKLLR